jgi:capsular polysaccharide transport system ATP-binding protein
MSSGMRSRVTFGLSLAFEFDYYLIDEGMAAGDPIFRKKAQAAFKARVQGQAHPGVPQPQGHPEPL